jgi:hypothetical protein
MRTLRTASGTDLADYEINQVPALQEALAAIHPEDQPLIEEGAAMDTDTAVRYALNEAATAPATAEPGPQPGAHQGNRDLTPHPS